MHYTDGKGRPEHGPRFVTVQHGLRGWFAVHYWWNDNPDEFGPGCLNQGFYEPWESDEVIFSYPTREAAIERAKEWAKALEMQYVDDP